MAGRRTRTRRCVQCGVLLPKDAGPNRRFCDARCRGRHWRRVRRYEEIYRRAFKGLGVIRGETLWAHGRCPLCGLTVSLRKRTDAVYCSPKCRTRAWRLRQEDLSEPG